MRTLIAAVSTSLLTLACVDEPPSERDCALQATVDDEHAIIAAVLRSHVGVQDSVVLVAPTTAFGDAETTFYDGALAADLLSRNTNPLTVEVEQLGDVGATVVVVDAGEVPSRQDPQSDAWLEFENTFGIDEALHVSRPGIGCDEAVVYVIRDCGLLCAEGLIIELVRGEDDAWTVVATDGVWVS